MPVKNNNDENNSHATFLAKALSFIVQSKNGMNEMITIGKGCKKHNVKKILYFLKAFLLQDRCSKDAANDQFNDPCHLNTTID